MTDAKAKGPEGTSQLMIDVGPILVFFAGFASGAGVSVKPRKSSAAVSLVSPVT